MRSLSESGGRIRPVRLEFRDERTPYSPLFEDVYFSPVSGLDESNYVYLEGSGLRSRIEEKTPGRLISVGEIGFGVGLNFLLALRAFQKHSTPGAFLNYFSFEKHPVVQPDLVRLYSAYPELSSESKELMEQYPILTPGIHLLKFCKGRVRLYLGLGDAHELLPRMDFRVDHWFWDGFAPKQNPDAFSETLMHEIARHSSPGTRGASFTSAGWVRRSLESAGFRIEKRPGFGKKRECISGVLERSPELTKTTSDLTPPWFSSVGLKPLRAGEKVAILGAGLAGSAAALALANSGAEVTVFDPRGIATRASGNPVGLFNAQISKFPTPMSRFSQSALTHAIRELTALSAKTRRGLLRTDIRDPAVLLRSDYPEDFFEVTPRGLLFPYCGILNPVDLCQKRIEASGARFVETELEGEFDHIIHSSGADGRETLPHLPPTRAIRGQVILVRPSPASRNLDSVLVEEGYASPLAPELTGGEEWHLIGATYQAKTVDPNQEELDTEALIEDARKWPEFSDLTREQVLSTRAGFRLSTPDKLPLIGPVCDPEMLERLYARALRGGRFDLSRLPPLPARPGEWVLTGLGSRGITTSTLCGEILAAMMLGHPLPIELDLLEHLHSARFFIRNLRKTAVK